MIRHFVLRVGKGVSLPTKSDYIHVSIDTYKGTLIILDMEGTVLLKRIGLNQIEIYKVIRMYKERVMII